MTDFYDSLEDLTSNKFFSTDYINYPYNNPDPLIDNNNDNDIDNDTR